MWLSTAAWPVTLWLKRSVMVIFSIFLMGLVTQAYAEEDFLDPEQAFQLSVAMVSPTVADIHFKIAPKYYMYQSRFAFAINEDEQAIGEPTYPPATIIFDPTFDQDMAVYRKQVTIRVPLQAGLGFPGLPLQLAITSQGCADAGLCYSPITDHVQLIATPDGYTAQGQWVVDSVPAPDLTPLASTESKEGLSQIFQLSDTGLAAYLKQISWPQMMVLAFVFGLLLSFTPCVLPMVPILLSIIAGQSGSAIPTKQRGLLLAATYVLGMSVVYTLLGVAAGLAGASLAAWLQTPWVLGFFAALLTLFALALFDVYSMQMPVALQSLLQGRLAKVPGGKLGGVFVMGMLSALIVGPCVAAPLAGVLLFISQTGDVVLGGSALFALAWGSGALLLLVGATSGALLPKAGNWMNGIKYAFGMLLLATALWMLNSVLADWLLVISWALLALWSAVLLGAFNSTLPGIWAALRKACGLALACWALFMLLGLAMGGGGLMTPLKGLSVGTGGTAVTAVAKPAFVSVKSVEELDQMLAEAQQPVLLDFYADWCVSCIEMEKFTFTDARVAQKMGQMLLLQADVTQNTEADRALLKRFHLFGPPGIIFFDADGVEQSDPRVIGFMAADLFSEQLNKVLR